MYIYAVKAKDFISQQDIPCTHKIESNNAWFYSGTSDSLRYCREQWFYIGTSEIATQNYYNRSTSLWVKVPKGFPVYSSSEPTKRGHPLYMYMYKGHNSWIYIVPKVSFIRRFHCIIYIYHLASTLLLTCTPNKHNV